VICSKLPKKAGREEDLLISKVCKRYGLVYGP
jgi:hypothetical protein